MDANVTHKSSITAVVLAGLTLVSFALVSSYVSKKPNRTLAPPTAPTPAHAVAPAAASATPKAEKEMYNDLGQAVALLDQLRDAVLAGDWVNAQNRFDEFTNKTRQLPAPQLNQAELSPLLPDFLALYRIELARALNEQQAGNARFALNQLYAIVSELRARLGSHGLPLEIVRLNFLVREVELWSQLNNEPLLHERLKALRETWQELRPVIAARRNGRELAAHFDTLVERLAASNQPTVAPALAALIAECNKDLEQMDSLFRRPPRSANPSGTGNAAKNAAEDEE